MPVAVGVDQQRLWIAAGVTDLGGGRTVDEPPLNDGRFPAQRLRQRYREWVHGVAGVGPLHRHVIDAPLRVIVAFNARQFNGQRPLIGVAHIDLLEALVCQLGERI